MDDFYLEFWKKSDMDYEAGEIKRKISFLFSLIVTIFILRFVVQFYNPYSQNLNRDGLALLCMLMYGAYLLVFPSVVYGLTVLLYGILPTRIFYRRK